MANFKWNWQAICAAILAIVALTFLPFAEEKGFTSLLSLALIAVAITASMLWSDGKYSMLVLAIATHGSAYLLLAMLHENEGNMATGYFLALAATWLMGWRLVSALSQEN